MTRSSLRRPSSSIAADVLLGRDLSDAWLIDPTRPFATFDTRRLQERRRFDCWRAFNADDATPFDIQLLDDSALPGLVKIIGGPDFGTCHMSVPSQITTRNLQQIKQSSQDLVMVMLINMGITTVTQLDRTVTAQAGDLLIVHMDQPFQMVHHEARSLDVVRMPASAFPAGLRDQSPLLLNPRLTPTATIAAGHIRWQPEQLDEFIDAYSLVKEQMIALLSYGVNHPVRQAAPGSPLYAAITSLIEDEIANPLLSAKYACAQLGISRSSFFAALAAQGTTLSMLVGERRMVGVLNDIRRNVGRDSLATISTRWGFHDSATFSRAFRRRYGKPPSKWFEIDQ